MPPQRTGTVAQWLGHGPALRAANPFQKPIENVALSANWNVHIWNWLRECYSRLYTGTQKRCPLQSSNFRWLKIQLKLTWRPFAIGAIFKTPRSHRRMCAGMPRTARRPTYAVNSVNLVILDLLDLFPGYKGGTIARLKRTLYGSRSAPKLWYKCLYAVLIELGFKSVAGHPCLFIRVTIIDGIMEIQSLEGLAYLLIIYLLLEIL